MNISINTDTNGFNHPSMSESWALIQDLWDTYGILPEAGDYFYDEKQQNKYVVVNRFFMPNNKVTINMEWDSDTSGKIQEIVGKSILGRS